MLHTRCLCVWTFVTFGVAYRREYGVSEMAGDKAFRLVRETRQCYARLSYCRTLWTFVIKKQREREKERERERGGLYFEACMSDKGCSWLCHGTSIMLLSSEYCVKMLHILALMNKSLCAMAPFDSFRCDLWRFLSSTKIKDGKYEGTDRSRRIRVTVLVTFQESMSIIKREIKEIETETAVCKTTVQEAVKNLRGASIRN